MHITSAPPLESTLFVLWMGPPVHSALDLLAGCPLFMQAPETALVGGEAPNEEKGLISAEADRVADKTDGKVQIGTEMVERLEDRPPRVLAVWTSATEADRGRRVIYTEAMFAGQPITVDMSVKEFPTALIADFVREPPFAARPVIGALIDYRGANQPLKLWRIEGEPEGKVLRAPVSTAVH